MPDENTTAKPLKAPFPYFGAKSRVAPYLWTRLGADVKNYVEPFFGSGAALLARPGGAGQVETVNDADGLLCNLWRCIKNAPDALAEAVDYPVSELDLHARHLWLIDNPLDPERLGADTDYYSVQHAAWWLWGACQWIGGGWCSGEGPWVVGEDGRLFKRPLRRKSDADAPQVHRQIPQVGNCGVGVHSEGAGTGIHALGLAQPGVARTMPNFGDQGRGVQANGVSRRLPSIAGDRGVQRATDVHTWLAQLSHRLRRVRIASGDFVRVLGPSVTHKHGTTAVLLDPPYSNAGGTYSQEYATGGVTTGAESPSARARAWCVENGHNPLLRIALCGYEGEHDALLQHGWTVHAWQSRGGYGNQGKKSRRGDENRSKERIWFSPHALPERSDEEEAPGSADLFDAAA